MMKIKFQIVVIFLFFSVTTLSVALETDPLNSPSWDVMHKKMLNNQPFVFDDKVFINAPDLAEDPMNVPISVTTVGLEHIEEIIVFADLNPIQKVLSFKPFQIKPYLSFRIKVEQSTPVRAAAKTSDGMWHVGGKWLEAAGGGCTAPSAGRVKGDWYENLMKVSSRLWFKNDELSRVRFRVMHPMDTGLAPGIPEFYIQQLEVIDGSGEVLAEISTYEPVSENPVFTLDIEKRGTKLLRLRGADNNGNLVDAEIGK